MNCREFKDQFEDSLNLSKDAKGHLDNCEDCINFQNENLQLSQVIRSLPKIAAPKDFEFGFRSKLAQAQLNKPLSPIWRTLRLALPLTAAVLIFGLVIINSNLFSNQKESQIVNGNIIEKKGETPESFIETTKEPNNNLVADASQENNESEDATPIEKLVDKKEEVKTSTEIADNKDKTLAKKESDKDEIRTIDSQPDEDSVKTIDLTIREVKPINPPGIEPNKEILTPRMPQNPKSFTATEILSQLGIETINENGLLKVTSVRKNSAGQTSGVKIGDIVVAVDGERLSNKPLRNRSVQGKTLRIQRGIQELNIIIKNR